MSVFRTVLPPLAVSGAPVSRISFEPLQRVVFFPWRGRSFLDMSSGGFNPLNKETLNFSWTWCPQLLPFPEALAYESCCSWTVLTVRVGGDPPGNLSPPLIVSKMSEYQDEWGYLTDSRSSRGTTNDGSRLCSRRPIPSPRGEPIRILVLKTPPYSLLGVTSLASSAPTGEFRPGTQTPNKALYCLILWLIGFILGGA